MSPVSSLQPGQRGQELPTSDASGSTIYEYIFFAGERVARRDDAGGNVFYFFADHLGSTRLITDATGSVQGDLEYLSFGGEVVASTTDTHKFTGYDRDSTLGLDYAGARYYKHTIGRFMSPDPTMGNVLNPQTWNRYAYVLNDPINLRDPSGLGVECITSSIDGQLTSGGCRWVDGGVTGDDLSSAYPILGIPNNTPVDEAYLAWLNRDAYAEAVRAYWAQQNSGQTPSGSSPGADTQPPQSQGAASNGPATGGNDNAEVKGPPAFQQSYSAYVGCVVDSWMQFFSDELKLGGNSDVSTGTAWVTSATTAFAAAATGRPKTALMFLGTNAAVTFSAASQIRTTCTQQNWNPQYGH